MTDSPSYDLYGWNTPNGQKIIIALEELGVNYTYHPVDISRGEQHTLEFRGLSPDGKIPALKINSEPATTLFESGAILLYLANRYPQLNGVTEQERLSVASWTFWQIGQLGPLAGQFGRFSGAETKNYDAIEHFEKLVWRCLNVLNSRLEQSAYLAGNTFTVADIATLPWISSKQSYLQIYDVPWNEKCPAIGRWSESLLQRPSVIKALNTATA